MADTTDAGGADESPIVSGPDGPDCVAQSDLSWITPATAPELAYLVGLGDGVWDSGGGSLG